MWGKLLSFNTKYIYLAVAVIVTLAVIFKVPLTPNPSGPTNSLFDHVESLREDVRRRQVPKEGPVDDVDSMYHDVSGLPQAGRQPARTREDLPTRP